MTGPCTPDSGLCTVARALSTIAGRRVSMAAGILLGLLLLAGCADTGDPDRELFLIRVGSRSATLAQFEMARELDLLAYPYEVRHDGQAMRHLHRRLLNTMVEELLVAERAGELGVGIDDQRLAAAVEEITADYPDGEFEKVLLERAVPFAFWQERLRARLLMERLIQVEFDQRIAVTQDELQRFVAAQADASASLARFSDAQIVQQVRRSKFEAAYQRWLDGLKARFPVEIDPIVWRRIEQRSGIGTDP